MEEGIPSDIINLLQRDEEILYFVIYRKGESLNFLYWILWQLFSSL